MKKIFRLVKHLPHTMFNLMLSLSASAYVVVVFLIKDFDILNPTFLIPD